MSERPPDPATLTALAAAFRRLQQKLERLAQRLEEMRDIVDAGARALEELLQALPRGVAALPLPAAPPTMALAAQVLHAEAEAGVPHLGLVPHADGSLDVRVNGRRALRLPPQPAMLFGVLVAPVPAGDDGLLPWRSRAELAATLSKLTDQPVTQRYVTKILHRIRRAFRAAGENARLLQVHRRLGVRFALRVV